MNDDQLATPRTEEQQISDGQFISSLSRQNRFRLMFGQPFIDCHRRDISELTPAELGEIVWQHRSCTTDSAIANRLRVKLWQVSNYIDKVTGRKRPSDHNAYPKPLYFRCRPTT